MRLIDADALIEKCGDWYVEEGTAEGFIGTIKQLIDTQPTIKPETNCSEIPNNWIPCSERLPEEYCECLVTYKSDGDQMFMDIVEYELSFEFDHEKNKFKGNWLFADDCRSVNPEVLAWMPLPEYYQEKDGEQDE